MKLSEFLEKYPPQPPRRPSANADESRLLDAADGVLQLDAAPARSSNAGALNDASTRHLWVIWPLGVPYLLESAPNVQAPLESGVAKHSNLTGAAHASCGGELWIDEADPSTLYVNGDSGRYGPLVEQQLEDAVTVLRMRGFTTKSCGWDADAARPAKFYRK